MILAIVCVVGGTLLIAGIVYALCRSEEEVVAVFAETDPRWGDMCWARTPHFGPPDHPERLFVFDGESWEDANGHKFHESELVR